MLLIQGSWVNRIEKTTSHDRYSLTYFDYWLKLYGWVDLKWFDLRIYGQNKNAVPCKYSVKGNDNKTSVSFAFRCHMSTSPQLTSLVSLKTVVLPVLHAAGVMFHFHTFIHVFRREAKQWFRVVKSELQYVCLICLVAFKLSFEPRLHKFNTTQITLSCFSQTFKKMKVLKLVKCISITMIP